jgi:hypothetical protein
MSCKTSVTIKMTIQDMPDVTVLLNRRQADLITEVLNDTDPNRVEYKTLAELRQYFNQLRTILPKALLS